MRASDLTKNHAVRIFLGDLALVSATTDNQGKVDSVVLVPTNARNGDRLVSVISDGTAITAACSLRVSTALSKQLEVKPY